MQNLLNLKTINQKFQGMDSYVKWKELIMVWYHYLLISAYVSYRESKQTQLKPTIDDKFGASINNMVLLF